jgi:hypothetical protein
MELFRAEKIAEAIHGASTAKCRFCAGKPDLLRTMVDLDTGCVIDMYECQCGDRTWGERIKIAAEESGS